MGRFTFAQTINLAQRCVVDFCGQYGQNTATTWTVPSGVTTATFEIWGGGSSGAMRTCCMCSTTPPGFPGGYALKTVAVTANATYTIQVGCGGCFPCYCGPGGSPTGCSGGTSYVTGTGLSNFCATGGGQPVGCYCYGYTCVCCGGQAFGGDVCLDGGYHWHIGWCNQFCHLGGSGQSPFGAPENILQNNHCCPYSTCGHYGKFPGGGGTGIYSCCCDCCYNLYCAGWGAPGLVRVTF